MVRVYAVDVPVRVVAALAFALAVTTAIVYGISIGNLNPNQSVPIEIGNVTYSFSWSGTQITHVRYWIDILNTPGQSYYAIYFDPPNPGTIPPLTGGPATYSITIALTLPVPGSILASLTPLWPVGVPDQTIFSVSPTPTNLQMSLWLAEMDGGYYVFAQKYNGITYNLNITDAIQFRVPIWKK